MKTITEAIRELEHTGHDSVVEVLRECDSLLKVAGPDGELVEVTQQSKWWNRLKALLENSDD